MRLRFQIAEGTDEEGAQRAYLGVSVEAPAVPDAEPAEGEENTAPAPDAGEPAAAKDAAPLADASKYTHKDRSTSLNYSSGADAEAAKKSPDERGAPKIGRNDECPCGSGKKYKQCCLH